MSDPTEPLQDSQVPAAAHEATEVPGSDDTAAGTAEHVAAEAETPGDVAAEAETSAVGAPKVAELSPAACGAKLAELFPALFGPEGPPKPLKLRIQADIQQRAPHTFTRRTLGVFFSRYTTGNAYLKALLGAPHRYDLDGEPAGEITAEHKAAATEELARRRAIAEERRAAEREARRAAEKAAFKERQKAERAAQGERRASPAARPHPPNPHRGGPAREPQHRPAGEPPQAPAVVDPARRDRAFLLRAFETSSLTKANFCALKRMSEAELDAQLELARQERGERPPRPPRA